MIFFNWKSGFYDDTNGIFYLTHSSFLSFSFVPFSLRFDFRYRWRAAFLITVAIFISRLDFSISICIFYLVGFFQFERTR